MKKLLMIAVLLTSSACFGGVFNTVTPNGSSIGLYNKFELEITLNTIYTNPFDPGQANMVATFTSPSGKVYTVYGFYHRGYTRTCVSGNQVLTSPVNSWKVRFAPNEMGTWKYNVSMTDAAGTETYSLTPLQFTCVSSTNRGFVGKSDAKSFTTTSGNNISNYLSFSNGEQFFPVGEALSFYDGWYNRKTCDYEIWLNNLGLNKANFIQLATQCYWAMAIEGADDQSPTGMLGNYINQMDEAYEIEWIIEACQAKGIYMQLVFMGTDVLLPNASYQYWTNLNPYNAAHGGPCTTPWDFFTNATAKQHFKNYIRYVIARWGYSTSIMSWELIEEHNALDNYTIGTTQPLVIAWYNEMSTYIKSIDQAKRLTTISFLPAWATNAYVVPFYSEALVELTYDHVYNPNNHTNSYSQEPDATEYVQFNRAKEYLDTYSKPFRVEEFLMAGEFVGDDPKGVLLHNGLWGTAFNGGFGPSVPWWWDNYVDTHNLYGEFKGVASYFESVNLLGDVFKAKTSVMNNSRMYYLQSTTQMYGWVHDVNYTYENLAQNYNNFLTTLNPAQPHPTVFSNRLINIPSLLYQGAYQIEWWNTRTGLLLSTVNVNSTGSTLYFYTPTNTLANIWDYAFKIKYVGTGYDGTCNPNDLLMLTDVNLDGKSELMLHNRCNALNGAFRTIDMTLGTSLTNLPHVGSKYNSWLDDIDYFYSGRATLGLATKAYVLVNRSLSPSEDVVMVVNPVNGAIMNIIGYSAALYTNWLNGTDRSFLGDVNGDGIDELFFINTSYSGGAYWANSPMDGSTVILKYYSSFATPLTGWLDATDKAFLSDVNGDNKDDLILVNTSYSGGAIRVIDVMTGTTLLTVNHGTFAGMMDATDKMMIGDVNADGNNDLLLANTSYASTFYRAISLTTGADIYSRTYALMSPGMGAWVDAEDRVFLGDMNGDNRDDLILVNTNYGGGGAIRSIDLSTGNTIYQINHGTFSDWMDCDDKMLLGDVNANGTEDLLLVNTNYSPGSGVFRSINLSTGANIMVKSFTDITPGLTGWYDGIDVNTNYGCPPSPRPTGISSDSLVVVPGERINVYPNPSDGNYTIESFQEIQRIEILNAIGTIVRNYTSRNSLKIQVDITEMPAGVYFLRIHTIKNIETLKIVKL